MSRPAQNSRDSWRRWLSAATGLLRQTMLTRRDLRAVRRGALGAGVDGELSAPQGQLRVAFDEGVLGGFLEDGDRPVRHRLAGGEEVAGDVEGGCAFLVQQSRGALVEQGQRPGRGRGEHRGAGGGLAEGATAQDAAAVEVLDGQFGGLDVDVGDAAEHEGRAGVAEDGDAAGDRQRLRVAPVEAVEHGAFEGFGGGRAAGTARCRREPSGRPPAGP
ncbi:hypothetical protein GCM10020254_74630 [Streptomyces goshikiensis]